jgi:predicted CXXCH cytochrome family protein
MKADLGKTEAARVGSGSRILAVAIAALLLFLPIALRAQTDCLGCHADKTLQDASGKSVGVDGDKFHASIHGSLSCSDCHTSIKEYPHPDKLEVVKCATCHAEQAKAIGGSIHDGTSPHPCTSCHGDAHSIFPKDDPRSAVYPLNIPRTCGNCHANEALAKKYGLQNVYATYMDSIHGYAVSKEGLLVAANCMSCHGSHNILSHKDAKSTVSRENVPNTCGACHGGVKDQYLAGIHGRSLESGNQKVPVCTDCHTAHAILQPTEASFRMQSTPICGSCHRDQLATYRDTFHSQLGLLGGYVETARCWDCHGAHGILPASDPASPINKGNLIKTCGRCHKDANVSFVQYQPHANPHNRKLNPALYFVRLFMNLLLWSTLSFFTLHTLLWFIRATKEQGKGGPAAGEKHD